MRASYREELVVPRTQRERLQLGEANAAEKSLLAVYGTDSYGTDSHHYIDGRQVALEEL